MKKTLLMAIVVAAAFWLSGCTSIMCEEHRCHRPRILRRPAVEVVEVIGVPGHRPPGPRPRPHPHARH